MGGWSLYAPEAGFGPHSNFVGCVPHQLFFDVTAVVRLIFRQHTPGAEEIRYGRGGSEGSGHRERVDGAKV